MQRLLLIEGSTEAQIFVRQALARVDVSVLAASTLSEADGILRDSGHSGEIDLILAELSLPDGDSLAFLSGAPRESALAEVPVILLTGRGDLTHKLAAFSMGVEDYLVKPVNPLELAARVEMRLRKSARRRRASDTIRKGRLILHTSLMRAYVSDGVSASQLELTAKEFKILTFLVMNEERAYSRPQLVRAVWGESVHVLDRTVDSHVCALRRKLRGLGHCIESIPGVGYRFSSKGEASKIPPVPPLAQGM